MATTPKVDSFIDSLRSRILAGEFGEGKLPPFRELVAEYKTSQETMNKAIQSLQAEGVVISSGVKGVFVNKNRLRVPAMVVNFYEEILKAQEKPLQVNIKKPEIITPSEELAKRMKLKVGEKVLQRIRKQGTSSVPYRLVEEYFPMSLIKEEHLENIYADSHFHIINAIRDDFGLSIKYTHEELTARLPSSEEQTQLQIVRANPVIQTQLTHFAEDKETVITYNHKILNANLFLLTYDYPVEYWK